MKFTPKIGAGILTIAALGLTGSVNHVALAQAPAQQVFQTDSRARMTPAVEVIPAVDSQRTTRQDYLPVTAWYKDKGWWKRHAPIIGGAAGGGLIGGLAGGGKGALIGGAAGAGGGYLYKHYHEHHHHYSTYKGQPNTR